MQPHSSIDSSYCSYCSQDAEEGFGKAVTSEEAIDTLLKSYRSSQIRKQVIKEVEKIGENVSFMFHSSHQDYKITRIISQTQRLINDDIPEILIFFFFCMSLGFWCNKEAKDSCFIWHSMPRSYKKIFFAIVSRHKQLLVAFNCLHHNSYKHWLYLLWHRHN